MSEIVESSDGTVEGRIELDAPVARELAGELGTHLRMISDALGVQVSARGSTVRVKGESAAQVSRSVQVVENLAALVASGRMLHPSDIRDSLRILADDPTTDLGSWFKDVILLDLRKKPITARTPNQRRYVQAMRRSEIVFGLGPAGTGKTFLAMAMAVSHLRKGAVRRIVLTRPAVEAGEKLGFLPGDLTEKVDPYLRPLFDALAEMIDGQELQQMMERNVIEVAPLAFMRGRTLGDAFVVLDEAQNTTVEQMKMFLTRLGQNGRMVITGDTTQVDLPRGQRSGLAHAVGLLQGVGSIDIIELTSGDVVRHPLVAKIVDAYAKEPPRRDDRPRDAAG